MFWKHYELIEVTDPHMNHVYYGDTNVTIEPLYELDIVYFNLIRFNVAAQRLDEYFANQGYLRSLTFYRGVLSEWVPDLLRSKLILEPPFFTSMHNRRTFIKFKSISDLRTLFPEYLL